MATPEVTTRDSSEQGSLLPPGDSFPPESSQAPVHAAGSFLYRKSYQPTLPGLELKMLIPSREGVTDVEADEKNDIAPKLISVHEVSLEELILKHQLRAKGAMVHKGIAVLGLDLGIGTDNFAIRFPGTEENCHGFVNPEDPLTGLPLPVLLVDPPSLNANTTFVDYHHLQHPAKVLLGGDDASIALRRSYGQDLPRWLHEHYHQFFGGPVIPETRPEKFTRVVLACAGVVPRAAIEFTKSGPFARESLNEEEYRRVLASTHHEGFMRNDKGRKYRNQIGMFFANYAVEQHIEMVITDSVIDQFLHTTDSVRQKELGNLMLKAGIEIAVESVRPLHKVAKESGLIKGRPTEPISVVKDFFLAARRQDYYTALRRKFNADYQPIVA